MAGSIDIHEVFARYFQGCEALAYALSSSLAEGHICLDIEEYLEEEDLLLRNPFFKDVEDFRRQTEEGKNVTHDVSALKPFVIHRKKAYLHRYFKYETEILYNLKRIGSNLHIITGGPGSGKTFSVSEKLVNLLEGDINLKIALAAPTGKAAARMNEATRKFTEYQEKEIREDIRTKLTELKAQTIHRLLGAMPGSVFFRFNENNHLPFDVLVIDECSMVDGAQMAKLLNAIGDKTVIYLIGDKDQLASVEAGSVFGDICRAAKSELLSDRVEFKTQSHRFSADKGIGRFSKQVIDGTFNDISAYDADEQVKIDTSFSHELFKEYAGFYEEYINEDDIRSALHLLNRVRFLCVTREHDHSVAEYNKKIQNFLARRIDGFRPRAAGFYHNQPVIITQNDYNLGIFNGDTAIIREKETPAGPVLVAHFENTDGTIREIPAGYLNHCETVFAMTIHKSQGSEFDKVVVVLPEKQGKRLLTRELLYTGVTRAKSNVLVQSTEEILMQCIAVPVKRASGLYERLNNDQYSLT